MPKYYYQRKKNLLGQYNFISKNQKIFNKWKAKLSEHSLPKIGINWQGNENYKYDGFRSIPLNKFNILLNISDLDFISIQKGEGEKQAAILQAEGVRESQIKRAEGEKQTLVLEATGQAEARIKVADAERNAIQLIQECLANTDSDPAQYLIAIRYLESLKEMTSGKDNKVVYVPYEATGILGSLGGIKDLLSGIDTKG